MLYMVFMLQCVQYVDSEVMKELVPRLTDLIKNNVGLATKAGCANLIISLCLQCPTELAPHAGMRLFPYVIHAKFSTVSKDCLVYA